MFKLFTNWYISSFVEACKLSSYPALPDLLFAEIVKLNSSRSLSTLKAFRALEVLPKVKVIWPLESTKLTPFLEAPPLVDFSTFLWPSCVFGLHFIAFPSKKTCFYFGKPNRPYFRKTWPYESCLYAKARRFSSSFFFWRALFDFVYADAPSDI